MKEKQGNRIQEENNWGRGNLHVVYNFDKEGKGGMKGKKEG
jgi:hypothetical protein